MRNPLLLVVIIAIVVSFNSCTTDPNDPKSFPLEQALVNGKPTLAEFGGTNCVPCKSMWSILDELAKEYEGKLNIVIVDVAKHQELADKYGVRMIPEQLYFDANGQVITRHLGAATKDDMYIQLEKIGIMFNSSGPN